MPACFHRRSARHEIAKVNLPVAVLIWLMIIPMLLKIDFAALAAGAAALARHRRDAVHQLGGEAVLDGAAGLAVHRLSVPALAAGRPDRQLHCRPHPAGRRALHSDGVRLVNLTKGEPHFTLSQVALNDTIMVVAFAPIVGLLLGLSAITVPWGTLVLSVVLYIVMPVIVAQTRAPRDPGPRRAAALLPAAGALQPLSLVALLATLVLLFGFQGEQIIAQPLIIALLAVPILIQVYFNSGLAYLLNRGPASNIAWPGPRR
jgi:ACR3 family arsenite transporter